MRRRITRDEITFVMKLAGDQFPECDVLEKQINNCLIEESAGLLEFFPLFPEKFKNKYGCIGEGSYKDSDEIYVVVILLERDGIVWHLDMTRVDGRLPISRSRFDLIRTLGYGNGLSLE